MSVEPRPPASTSAPCDAAPRPNASASGPEEVRMSCTVTTSPAPVSLTNAAPIASATPSSSCSGTIPLMSYALKMLARSPTAGSASRDRTGDGRAQAAWPAPSLSVLRRPGAQHSQVAAPTDLDALADGLLFLPGPRLGLHHRVGERLQVIGAVLSRIRRQPDHVPAARRGQPARVFLAQVIAVRLHVRRQRSEDCGGVAVHVGQRVYRRMLARGARAATGTHQPTSLTHRRTVVPEPGTASDTTVTVSGWRLERHNPATLPRSCRALRVLPGVLRAFPAPSRSDTLGDCADRRRQLEARCWRAAEAAGPAWARAARQAGTAGDSALPQPRPAVRRPGA